jgi:hypothetical protein
MFIYAPWSLKWSHSSVTSNNKIHLTLFSACILSSIYFWNNVLGHYDTHVFLLQKFFTRL